MPLKCHFSAADLREIWRQHVNRCDHQSHSLWKRITTFCRKGVTYPQNRLFELCFNGCVLRSLQTTKALVKTTILSYSPNAKIFLCLVTFCLRVTILEILYTESTENLFTSALLFCTLHSDGLNEYCYVCPVSYTHLTLPTNREV